MDQLLGVSSGWVEKRTGVSQRHWVADETPVFMAAAAARDALKRSGLEACDIDLIIYAAASPQQFIPDTASLVQRELGLGNSGTKAFSIHSTCLGFLTALDVAATYIEAGKHQRILITGAEIASVGLDMNSPESAALFGDMGTAAVVSAARGTGSVLGSLVFETYGDGADLCRISGGGPHWLQDPPERGHEDSVFRMDGPAVFRLAIKYFPSLLDRALQIAGVEQSDIDILVPHQASLHGLRAIPRKWGFPDDRVMVNIGRFGNCISCSLPSALFDALEQGRIKRGDTVMLAGSGAGVSLAAAVLTW